MSDLLFGKGMNIYFGYDGEDYSFPQAISTFADDFDDPRSRFMYYYLKSFTFDEKGEDYLCSIRNLKEAYFKLKENEPGYLELFVMSLGLSRCKDIDNELSPGNIIKMINRNQDNESILPRLLTLPKLAKRMFDDEEDVKTWKDVMISILHIGLFEPYYLLGFQEIKEKNYHFATKHFNCLRNRNHPKALFGLFEIALAKEDYKLCYSLANELFKEGLVSVQENGDLMLCFLKIANNTNIFTEECLERAYAVAISCGSYYAEMAESIKEIMIQKIGKFVVPKIKYRRLKNDERNELIESAYLEYEKKNFEKALKQFTYVLSFDKNNKLALHTMLIMYLQQALAYVKTNKKEFEVMLGKCEAIFRKLKDSQYNLDEAKSIFLELRKILKTSDNSTSCFKSSESSDSYHEDDFSSYETDNDTDYQIIRNYSTGQVEFEIHGNYLKSYGNYPDLEIEGNYVKDTTKFNYILYEINGSHLKGYNGNHDLEIEGNMIRDSFTGNFIFEII